MPPAPAPVEYAHADVCSYNRRVHEVPRVNAFTLFAVPAATLVAMVALSTFSGPAPLVNMTISMFNTLAGSIPLATMWLVAAFGTGFPLRTVLFKRSAPDGAALQLALGVAAMLFLDQALGASCVLLVAQPWIAWVTLAPGLIIALVQLLRRAIHSEGFAWRVRASEMTALAAVPAVAVLFIAATSAPGWLWSSEFGGYDALSYHLQLPNEWVERGRIEPLEHNVYSFLPGYAEGAYVHLYALAGNKFACAYASQMLHAMIACAAAWTVCRLTSALGGSAPASALAGAIVIGTPWVVVTGSLAYNEMFVILLFAAAWLAVTSSRDIRPAPGSGGDSSETEYRRFTAAGILIGAACGAKLTAVGFAAAPLLAIVLLSTLPRVTRVARLIAIIMCAATAVLLPYLLRNMAHAGNPVFPFFADLFGHAHWTAEQFAIWHRGHSFDGTLLEHGAAIWNQLIRLGLGKAPGEFDDVWLAQWSLMFPLGIVACVIAAISKESRRCAIVSAAIIAIQIVFWLFFTHLKARFMLPAVVPLAVVIAFAFQVAAQRSFKGRAALIGAILALGSCVVPAAIFLREGSGAPAARIGLAHIFAGSVENAEAVQSLAEGIPAAFINTQTPPGSRVLLVGEAAPFYFDAVIEYQTAWDRGSMSRIMASAPGDEQHWIESLRREGFTHLYIDVVMLNVWADSGWRDPNLDPEAMIRAAEAHAQLVAIWDSGSKRLYSLE